jgi:hypothetical protein
MLGGFALITASVITIVLGRRHQRAHRPLSERLRRRYELYGGDDLPEQIARAELAEEQQRQERNL